MNKEFKLPKTRIVTMTDGNISRYYAEEYVENEFQWVFFPFAWKRVTGWVDLDYLFRTTSTDKDEIKSEIDHYLGSLRKCHELDQFRKNKRFSYEDYPDE